MTVFVHDLDCPMGDDCTCPAGEREHVVLSAVASTRFGIKEVFDTLQGEGTRAGARSVFVRFSGCNLWDGHPLHRDRGAGACARWCDTDFFKGEVYTGARLLDAMDAQWAPIDGVERWCVLTGGEPSLQLSLALVHALHVRGWKVAIETNGTSDSDAVRTCDHVCVSPKLGAPLRLTRADEVKVVLPGDLPPGGWTDAALEELEERFPRAALYVQPMDPLVDDRLVEATVLRGHESGNDDSDAVASMMWEANVKRCLAFVHAHPAWRVSVQTHKILNVP